MHPRLPVCVGREASFLHLQVPSRKAHEVLKVDALVVRQRRGDAVPRVPCRAARQRQRGQVGNLAQSRVGGGVTVLRVILRNAHAAHVRAVTLRLPPRPRPGTRATRPRASGAFCFPLVCSIPCVAGIPKQKKECVCDHFFYLVFSPHALCHRNTKGK